MENNNKGFKNLYFPFSYGSIWFLMLLLFGIEFFLLFLFPLFAMIGFWAMLSAYILWFDSEDEYFEKPKRKPKHIDWDEPEIV